MFGPNAASAIREDVVGHHREPSFSVAFDRVRQGVRQLAGLGRDWDILILTGSGSLGVEACVASLAKGARPPAWRGTFTGRMRDTMALHGVLDDQGALQAGVALETSTSDHQDLAADIVDAVSSFPYYPITASARLWATVSSKQLGGPPVLALVAVREDFWAELKPRQQSYLSLAAYREAAADSQTPFTPAMPLVMDLARRLERLDVGVLRRRMDANADRIVAALGDGALIGAARGPVLTVPKAHIAPAVAKAFELYGLHTGSPNYQIFTYSEAPQAYDHLAAALAQSSRVNSTSSWPTSKTPSRAPASSQPWA